ncbi:hypothetical protein DsansV1_C15g0137471 [Dioscorea sansibarensis]
MSFSMPEFLRVVFVEYSYNPYNTVYWSSEQINPVCPQMLKPQHCKQGIPTANGECEYFSTTRCRRTYPR